MDGTTVLAPPIAFAITLTAGLGLWLALSRLRFKRTDAPPSGLTKPYACGEDLQNHLIRPDYAQFFPFAFFFTILHVVALMLTTVPTETAMAFVIAMVYVLVALVGLFALYGR